MDSWALGHRSGLDQLRGLAVLLVVLGHCFPDSVLGWAGGVGVTLFFVLSGFLITRLLLEERREDGRIGLPAFYARRARRLLPALPFALLAAGLMNARTGGALLEPVISSLTYTANYASISDPSFGSFGHLWSLAIEEHFYMVWPCVVAFLAPRRLALLAVCATIVVVAARLWVGVDDPGTAYRATHLRIDALLIGAVLAVVVHRLGRPPRIATTLAVVVLALFCHPDWQRAAIAWGVGLLALGSAVLVLDALHWRRHLPGLARLGVVSYGVYLFHVPVINGLRLQGLGPGVGLFVSALVLSVCLAEASFRLVESRFRTSRPSRSHENRSTRAERELGFAAP